jgi:hypothetical protein
MNKYLIYARKSTDEEKRFTSQMVEAAGIGLSSHFVRCRAADSFSFRFSPSFRFL